MAYIKLQNISLDYPLIGHDSFSFQKMIFSLFSKDARKNHKSSFFRAIDDLSLELFPGDRLAIVGRNGAGKTTLLKLMSGIYTATKGLCERKGRITTLLGTGFGLDEDATGYQNILFGGIALGYSLKEMKSKFKDIEDFTELGEFLKFPLRTYSSGMKARLAFAIATCIEPEILIIDEGMGAGDAQFLAKAEKRISSFISNASILVFASHSNTILNTFCNKCLYMQQGKPLFLGDLEEGIKIYEDSCVTTV